jgi:ribosomal subunit interface protein
MMSVTITGRHIDISDAFREAVESGLEELSSKHNLNPIETTIVLSKQSFQFTTDINAHLARGVNLRTRGEGGDAYSCWQNALDKLKERVRRHKSWMDDHHKHKDTHFERAPSYVLAAEQPTTSEFKDGLAPAIIAETMTEIPTLSVGDAVTRFDFSDESAYIFRNIKNDKINVVYRRADGNIGWINPENAST